MGFGIYIFVLVIVGYEVVYSSGDLLDPFISIESLRTRFSRKQDSVQPFQFERHYFTQMLDHFTFVPEGSRTFQQRYFLNKAYWGGAHNNSPIFVFIGDESFIHDRSGGLVRDNAPKFNALHIIVEV